jgi:DNA ligase-1
MKPIVETLDLVVVGADWGEGRRANLIGSYMLACYDPETAEFLEIGRVGTGITDEQLAELTELFSQYIISEDGGTIELQPAIVFEIAYEEIQKSKHYASGYALRFPRLVRVRFDKTPEDADSVERVERLAGG